VAAVFALLRSPAIAAQQPATIARAAEPFLGDIGGARLGQLTEGTVFASGPTRGAYTQVTLEGWIFKPSTQPVSREGHNVAIRHGPVENLRDAPNGHVLAQLVQGFLLDKVDERGQWVKARRTVWVQTAALRIDVGRRRTDDGNASPAAGTPTSVIRPPASVIRPPASVIRPPASVQDSAPPDPHRGVVRRRMQLYRAPDSASVGQLEAGTPVRITARAQGWVRIETQAWVRENEIRPSDNAILTGITAAELRGAPDDFRGRLLRWTIQFLSVQTADELRPDFQPGQRYILARGPAPEYAFVYIVIPEDKLADVQRLEPLASVSVVARVLNGRSTYLANPILELVELP
jgi:hypothetical protein